MKESPRLWPRVQALRGKTSGKFCHQRTDLCLEGYESSANTYVFEFIRALAPTYDIAHHTHAVANLKLARQHDVPMAILYRDPADAIPSLVSRFKPSVHEAVRAYRVFYRYVCEIKHDCILVSFSEATGDIRTVIGRIESETDLQFPAFDVEETDARVRSYIREWTRKHRPSRELSLPQVDREKKKAAILDDVVTLPEFADCRSYFEELERAREERFASCSNQ